MNIYQFQKELAAVMTDIENPKTMLLFLQDILTPTELEDMSKRLQIVKKLQAGESQRQIAEELQVGIATVTRGSRQLKQKHGGFQQVLKKK